jgi:phenylacetate-CoA ligase
MAVQAKPMYWNEEMETMPRDRLERLQLERLQRIVDYVYHRVPHYRRKMDEAGVKPSDIRHLQDIVRSFPSPPRRICGRPIPSACSPSP